MHRIRDRIYGAPFSEIALSTKYSRRFVFFTLFLRVILGMALFGTPGCIGHNVFSVEGVVMDEDENVIEGATLEFTCPERELIAETMRSHEEGQFAWKMVHYGSTSPSKVTIVCSKEGYQSQTLSPTLAEKTKGLKIVLRRNIEGETAKDK